MDYITAEKMHQENLENVGICTQISKNFFCAQTLVALFEDLGKFMPGKLLNDCCDCWTGKLFSSNYSQKNVG